MLHASASPENSTLLRQLARIDRRARLVSLLNGLGVAGLFVSGVVVAAVLADLAWEVPLQVRIGWLATAGLVALAGVLRALWRCFGRRFDPAAAAALVESTYPELQERLSSAIELEADVGTGGSALMRAVVARQAAQGLSQLDLATPLPVGRATRRGAVGAIALAALLSPCLFFGSYRLLLARFATPWRNLERTANLTFVVVPGDATVSRGADVEITAEPHWSIARTEIAAAWLRWSDAAGQQFERQMTWSAERGTFTATVADVLQPFDFEIAANRTRTRSFHIDVVDRPALAAASALIEPPAYTGRAVQQIDGVVGELEVLRGSRLQLRLQFTLPVVRAALKWMADPVTEAAAVETELTGKLSDDGLSAEIEFVPESSGRIAIHIHDTLGLVLHHEPQRHIRLVEDAPPTVLFTDHSASSQAGPHDVLRFPVAAMDDIGLAALDLHYEVVGQPDSSGQIDSTVPLLGFRQAQDKFSLDLAPLGLAEGAVLSVRARAADERPDPGPNESWTEPQLITISTQAKSSELQELTERQQELAQTLQQLRAAVAKNRQTTEELHTHAVERQQAGAPFERAADVSAVAEADRTTIAEAERLAAMFELHPVLSSLGERTRTVGREQLAEAAQQTANSRDAAPAERTSALAAAGDRLKQAEAELEAIQRDLETLADLEQDLLELQRLADDAERLADGVQQLRKSTPQPPDSGPPADDPEAMLRALAADRLRADHADLTQRLDDLLNRRPELIDAAAEHALGQLDALRSQAEQLAGREQRLADSLEKETAPQPPTDGDRERVDQLAARQSQLAEQAVQAALAAAEADGQDAQSLEAIADQAARAADATADGDLSAATSAAQQAAEDASEAARSANASAGDALREFAQSQQELARQLSETAGSAAARAAARQQSQQRTVESTAQLQQEFREIAEELTADPLDRAEAGAQATESSAATEQAQSLMQQSAEAQAGGQNAQAADAARQAAAQLAAAAGKAAAAAQNAPDSPVPTEVGQQVAQASRQLRRAGAELEDGMQSAPQAQEGEGSQPGEGDSTTAGQRQPGGENPMPNTGDEAGQAGRQAEGASGEQPMSSDLAQAAAALQAAAQRLKPRTPGEQQAPGEGGMSQQAGTSPQADSSSKGSGTTESLRLTDLANKIKARSMRNWGELPGELRSELQQRTQSRPDADYAPLIRMYFNEISRRKSPTTDE